MEYIKITGQKRLAGSVNINGCKNAAVAILPAALAAGGVCVIDNLPNIYDIEILTNVIRGLGVKCDFRDEQHTLVVDSRGLNSYAATDDALKNMRGSYYLLGALLGRFKRAEVTYPGGCNLGARPIDYHLNGFKKLGAEYTIEHGIVKLRAEKLTGNTIMLDIPSVGATINIMLAAVYAEGETHIENAAKEPHVVDTANFLNKLGANIKGAGTDIIRVRGVTELRGGEYTIITDQIEAGTYMIAAAITGGDVTVNNIIPKHMDSLTAKLTEIGCSVEEHADGNSLRVIGGELSNCRIKTNYYPGFPTDLQPQMTALLCMANGTSHITENVYEHRFQSVTELRRFGAKISVEGRLAIIEGAGGLNGAAVNATDLRAGAALIIAGLAARGETLIGNVKYLDRGYEDFENKLRALGADVHRVELND